MDDEKVVSDIDTDIEQRKKLIEEAKQIDNTQSWNDIFPSVKKLQSKWKSIERWESSYEEELEHEFNEVIDSLYSIRNKALSDNKALKEDVIKEAKEVSKETNFKNATTKMNALMDKWKSIPSAGKDIDDTLWASFNGIRQDFFDAKAKFFEQRKDDIENARQVKNDIIQKAEELKNSTEFQKTSNEFKDLMTKWKETIYTTKEDEDALWEKFNGARQTFYKAKEEYYEKLHLAQDERYTAKKELISKIDQILETNSFTKENTELMKSFNNKWKEIGSCGKEKENEIYSEFKEKCNKYFNGLKAMNEEKHNQWLQNMTDAKNRKLALIQKQESRLAYLQRQKAEVIIESAEQEYQDAIEDTEDFIKELKEQLEDIENKLKK